MTVKNLISSGKCASSTKEIVNIFNTFFANIGKEHASKLKSTITNLILKNKAKETLNFRSVPSECIYKHLQSLCSAKATGCIK